MSSSVLLTKICPRKVITWPQRSTKETNGSFLLSSVRKDSEKHVPDSSNHSLSLIKLFSFSCPEGNKLLDCSVGLSPFFSKDNERCERQYRHEATPALALLKQVHHLSSPDTLCLTQTTFKITEYFHILVHVKNTYAYTKTNTYSYTFTYRYTRNICMKYIYIFVILVVKDTTTFEMELCGHKQATAHAHVRPHCV